jgi:YggT family protein
MLAQALQFLLDTLVQPFAAILLLRFHLQWLRAPLRNPVGEFVMVFTDFVVLRTRRFIASAWGYDTATLLLAAIVEGFYVTANLGVQGYPFTGLPLIGLLAWTVVKLLKMSIYLLIGSLFVEAILSWVNPHTPLAPVLNAINRPFLSPLRRRLPNIGNLDLSVLALFILCQLILIVPVTWLERLAVGLL